MAVTQARLKSQRASATNWVLIVLSNYAALFIELIFRFHRAHPHGKLVLSGRLFPSLAAMLRMWVQEVGLWCGPTLTIQYFTVRGLVAPVDNRVDRDLIRYRLFELSQLPTSD